MPYSFTLRAVCSLHHFLVAASKWALAFLPLARASEVYLSVLVEGIR
jgi:hypothetical protein